MTVTYDLAAFRGQTPSGVSRLTPTLLGDGGALITGALKVAQFFLVDFQTEQGSVPYDPKRGTPFMTSLRGGRFRTETDVFMAFAFADGALRSYAASVEDPAAPLDERYAGAILNAVTITPGFLSLNITVRTRAGASRAVTLPVTALI